MSLILGVDIDGVLADFNQAYIDLVIKVSGRDLFPPRPFDIPTWFYPEYYGYTDEEVKLAWKEIKNSHDFWWNLSPYAHTQSFIDDLWSLDLPTYFITQRMGPRVKEQTEEWLVAQGAIFPTVLVSGGKGACCKVLDITHYIDDKTENCEDVRDYSPKTQAYMLKQPWNKEIHSVPRLDHVNEWIEAIKSHKESQVL